MKIIGLTGSIGSGKSTVSKIIRETGISVICADEVAHQVVKVGTPAYQQIIQFFGKEILLPDQSINREKLGKLVFKDEGKRKLLNSIVHPEVIKKMQQEIKNYQKNKAPLVFLDIPLLYESGLENICDQVVVAYAPETIMIERIKKRDGLSDQEIKNRITSQMSIEEKKKKADYVIDNSGNLTQTKKQIEKLLKEKTFF